MSSHACVIEQPANGRDPVYRLGPEVLLVPVEDGIARLLDFAGKTFALSEVAARMLRDTLELGAAGAEESCARYWGVETARVRADLDALWRTSRSRACWWKATNSPDGLGSVSGSSLGPSRFWPG